MTLREVCFCIRRNSKVKMIQIYQSGNCFKKQCVLLSIWLCFYHVQISHTQFHFGNPLTTERSNVPIRCNAPNGKESFCVPTDRCTQLSALIKNLQKPISVDVGKYIKDSFVCKGNSNGKSSNAVCCPVEGIRTRLKATQHRGDRAIF